MIFTIPPPRSSRGQVRPPAPSGCGRRAVIPAPTLSLPGRWPSLILAQVNHSDRICPKTLTVRAAPRKEGNLLDVLPYGLDGRGLESPRRLALRSERWRAPEHPGSRKEPMTPIQRHVTARRAPSSARPAMGSPQSPSSRRGPGNGCPEEFSTGKNWPMGIFFLPSKETTKLNLAIISET